LKFLLGRHNSEPKTTTFIFKKIINSSISSLIRRTILSSRKELNDQHDSFSSKITEFEDLYRNVTQKVCMFVCLAYNYKFSLFFSFLISKSHFRILISSQFF